MTGNELFKSLKNKLSALNLWHTLVVTNSRLFDKIQDLRASAYREKLQCKAEGQHDRTRWLRDFDYSYGFDEVRAPDFEKVIL